MAQRHEFKFVVSGTNLSSEHKEIIANAVADAGARALVGLSELPKASVTYVMPEWLGIWLEILEGEQLKQVAARAQAGFSA